MLPVYRIRDGWSNLTHNKAIFETCIQVLSQKEAIVIFPEGNHNLARRVRPLSKGFTRIVFDTLDTYPNLDLQLVPVGLNFVNATGFPDSAAMYFGAPISVQDFVSENRNDAVVHLKERIKTELTELTTHIPEENYESILKRLDALNVNYLKPKAVNTCIQSNFKNCTEQPKRNTQFVKKLFSIILIASIFIPFLIWKFIVKPKIDEPEFIATFRFAVALTLVPVYLIASMLMLIWLSSLTIGLIYLAAVVLIALLAVKL
jgi:hypothetical protein